MSYLIYWAGKPGVICPLCKDDVYGGRGEGFSSRRIEAQNRSVLIALYRATGGANWTNNTNWLDNRPIREWYGVISDLNGRVIQLNLGGNNLNGSLPPQLRQLAGLRELRLAGNNLTGSIPSELGNLDSLEFLDLGYNSLTGPIPEELCKLTNLRLLALRNNSLTGPLPAELGSLSSLTRLYLDDTRLTGPLPSNLAGLVLELIHFDNTQLCAPLDPTFQSWLQGIPDRRGDNCAP